MAVVPEGVTLASIRHEPWTNALRESLDPLVERMRKELPGTGSRSHTYVEPDWSRLRTSAWRSRSHTYVEPAVALVDIGRRGARPALAADIRRIEGQRAEADPRRRRGPSFA